MTGVDCVKRRVGAIGDMPALVRDNKGVIQRVLIRNVRLVSSFQDTLFSVDQFWKDARIDTQFADRRYLEVPSTPEAPTSLRIPFERRDKLFQLWVMPIGQLPEARATEAQARVLKTSVHGPKAVSHVAALPPDQLLGLLHRRLHIGFEHLRRLGQLAADVPPNIVKGIAHACEHCKEANAAHLPHKGSAYAPSYAGRLVHADIAGPFKRSMHGQYQYFIILTDDHSRFKMVFFLRNKSEAVGKIRTFVRQFNAILNRRCNTPKQMVGSLHMDNAGEFLSKEFQEMLDEELVAQTRCPAHVHQLNGVAERSIRTVMENVRANRVASGASIGFWPYMVAHAVDCINRTTGPPDSNQTSFEALTGEQPKVMSILPFGCLTYAVKPREAFSKTNMDSRAWVGINLGRSAHTPGAYDVWIQSLGKTVCSSEVYFDESFMPWRAKGDQRVGEPMPALPPATVESDLHSTGPPHVAPEGPTAQVERPPADTPAEAFDRATQSDSATARRSRKVLLLFSGPYARFDGLSAFLNQLGLEVECIDNDPASGGGAEGDILNDDVHNRLLQRVIKGEFFAIFAAPPCSTFSVSRHYTAKGSADGGPPVVRDRSHIAGLPHVPEGHRRELLMANAIVARTAALVMAGFHRGVQYVVENPADRGDPAHPRRFLTAEHGPVWRMKEMLALKEHYAGKEVTFAMCNFGSPWQKYSTLLYSPGLESWLAPLGRLQCTHSTHAKAAGGTVGPEGQPSSETSAYPANFNHYVARALASLHLVSNAPAGTSPQMTPSAADGNETVDPALAPVYLPMPPVAKAADAKAADAVPSAVRPPLSPSVNQSRPAPARAPLNIPPPVFEHGGVSVDVDDTDAPAEPSPTARGRQTRAARPALASGLSNSTGWVALMRAATVAAMSTGQAGFAGLAKAASIDPKSQSEAYAQDRAGWQVSEAKEMANHADNGSWSPISRSSVPRGRNLVKLIWVYKVKRDGSLKSRLCVQGCRQVKGVDFDQTWCGTMRGASLRALTAISARTGMRMRRWDFVSAYLQGELLDGEVTYCLPPPGYHPDGRPLKPGERSNEICKILKPVYGMAQAGRRWQRTLYPWLQEFGFKQCDSDPNVFTLEREMATPTGPRLERVTIGAYVDDLATLYQYDDTHSLYAAFAAALQERFKVEDEGDVHDLLGIEFDFGSDGTVTLHQKTYIEKLVSDFFPDGVPAKLQSGKPPADHTLCMHVADAMSSTDEVDPALLRRYQSLVGALLYCSGNTRPDVAFAVGYLCRAMSRPTPELLEAALRVLGYLYRNRHIGLRYQADEKPLAGQSDSDWGVRHSTSGWQFTYSQAVVSWGSKKQSSVALSSCEAEIMAASEAAKEAIYLARFLGELGLPQTDPVEMAMDNQAAIAISYNPELHSRTKHIDRRHFFVRECVENMQLRVPFVGTADNAADFFTKPLAAKAFYALRDRLMNVPREQT